ncbi:MAG TPA: hypothetical protein VHE60_06965 [Pyrinomonadaceae bacterium]|nr:hypothetical protein [Pyrinomonadaceae bacterium]
MLFLFVAFCLAVAPLVSTALAAPIGLPFAQQQTQPLDPLTREETELAMRIASSDARVKEALGAGRSQLIQVQFLALKPNVYPAGQEPEQMKIGRHAAVLFYRYDNDQGIHVIVDLEKRSAGEIARVEGRAVPLAFEEVTQAANLALRNERVRSLLGSRADDFRVANLAAGERPENRVEGLRVVATSPRDPCYRHRCIDLLFRQRDGYIAGTTVTVDLTSQAVRVERTVK